MSDFNHSVGTGEMLSFTIYRHKRSTMAEGRADTRGSEELVPLAPLSGTGLVLKSDAEQQFTACRADKGQRHD